MEKESQRIEGQIHAAFEGPAWHGPSLMEILDGVTADEAAARPLAFAHSIWEIVNHIHAWDRAVTTRLVGQAIELDGNDDWPPVRDTSAQAWQRTLDALRSTNIALRNAVAGLSDGRLRELTPGKDYDNYTLLHGIVQHMLYHAGQIALIKKALRT